MGILYRAAEGPPNKVRSDHRRPAPRRGPRRPDGSEVLKSRTVPSRPRRGRHVRFDNHFAAVPQTMGPNNVADSPNGRCGLLRGADK